MMLALHFDEFMDYAGVVGGLVLGWASREIWNLRNKTADIYKEQRLIGERVSRIEGRMNGMDK